MFPTKSSTGRSPREGKSTDWGNPGKEKKKKNVLTAGLGLNKSRLCNAYGKELNYTKKCERKGVVKKNKEEEGREIH